MSKGMSKSIKYPFEYNVSTFYQVHVILYKVDWSLKSLYLFKSVALFFLLKSVLHYATEK